MNVLVVGAGAVGAYFGARLQQAGHRVRLVARGANAAALGSRGLRIDAGGEAELVGPFELSTLEGAAGFGADAALVAVKAGDLREVGAGLGACLSEQGVVVPLLNGVESEAELASFVGAERVLAAVAYMSAERAQPGELRVVGVPRAGLAPCSPEQSPRVEQLADCFNAAGIPTMRHEDAAKMLWQKMLWNVPFNALCALTGLTAGEVVDDAGLLEIATQCMGEVLAVAASQGAALPDSSVEAMVAVTRAQFPATVPSMLQDLRAGRPTEVDALQGAVVRFGRAAGVPTPVTGTLAALVRARQRARLSPSTST